MDIATAITDVRRLQMGPTDTLVLTVDGNCTSEQAERIKVAVRSVLGANVRVLILTKDITATVIEQQAP